MNFYVVDVVLFDDKNYAYGETVDLETGESEKCPVCGLAVGKREWLPPRKVKLSKSSFGDFVFGVFDVFLASERFKNEYLNSGLTGIKEFQPVEIVKVITRKKVHIAPPNYYNVLIVRGKAKIDDIKSEFVRDGEIKCDFCKGGGIIKSYKGIHFEPDTWSGEDIFFPIGLSGTVVVSQRFVDFVNSNNFTNINFTPAEQYITPWVRNALKYKNQ